MQFLSLFPSCSAVVVDFQLLSFIGETGAILPCENWTPSVTIQVAVVVCDKCFWHAYLSHAGVLGHYWLGHQWQKPSS